MQFTRRFKEFVGPKLGFVLRGAAAQNSITEVDKATSAEPSQFNLKQNACCTERPSCVVRVMKGVHRGKRSRRCVGDGHSDQAGQPPSVRRIIPVREFTTTGMRIGELLKVLVRFQGVVGPVPLGSLSIVPSPVQFESGLIDPGPPLLHSQSRFHFVPNSSLTF